MFLSTYEKQLDGKRRLLIPQEYRTADNGAEHGVFCFPSMEFDCLEAGGEPLFGMYRALIDSLPFGDPYRSALEASFYGAQKPLAFDAGGRITLPDYMCEQNGLSDTVVIFGVGDRFQIWNQDKWRAHLAEQNRIVREGRAAFSAMRRPSVVTPGGGA